MFLFVIVLCGLLMGCNSLSTRKNQETITVTTGQIIAQEQLSEDNDADFIYYRDVVYLLAPDTTINFSHNQLEKIGEVESAYHDDVELTEISATKLDVGTKVFKLNDVDQLIIERAETFYVYEAIPEG